MHADALSCNVRAGARSTRWRITRCAGLPARQCSEHGLTASCCADRVQESQEAKLALCPYARRCIRGRRQRLQRIGRLARKACQTPLTTCPTSRSRHDPTVLLFLACAGMRPLQFMWGITPGAPHRKTEGCYSWQRCKVSGSVHGLRFWPACFASAKYCKYLHERAAPLRGLSEQRTAQSDGQHVTRLVR